VRAVLVGDQRPAELEEVEGGHHNIVMAEVDSPALCPFQLNLKHATSSGKSRRNWFIYKL
jgi:hypothetical protein